jgi:uncharacterized lipoprotein YehR (DUF1307 family)
MKKVLSIAAVAALAVSFTACKKNYTCTYEYEVGGVKSTVTAECTKCSKKDVKELEDAGYTCE